MIPKTLDHVALWVADRDRIADFVTTRLGMHVIDRSDAFTLVGADARRFKLTLVAADEQLGFAPAGPARVEVSGAFVRFVPGRPGNPERPLLNHLAVLVDSAEQHRSEAERLGIEVADFVDAPNTLAVFVWGPEHVKVEYVEHKPTFSLV